MGRLACSTCVLLAVMGLAPVAAAQSLELRWEGPAGCPSTQEVASRAGALLQTSAVPGAPLRVDARAVVAEDGGWTLVLEGRDGRRTLAGESCEVLADAAALIAAMMVDPEAVTQAQAQAPEAEDRAAARATAKSLEGPRALALSSPTSGVLPAVASAREEPSEDATVPSDGPGTAARSVPVRLRLGAGARLDVGSMPTAAVGPSLSVGLAMGALSLEVRGTYLPPSTAGVPNHPRASAEVELLAASVAACGALWRGAVEAGPCGSLELGAIHAEGRGVSTPGGVTATWAAVSAGAFLAVPVGDWLALRATAEALAPITRAAFVIDGVEGEVHRASPLAARLGLGVEVRFR